MARAANTASVEDVCKALRGCCVSLHDSYKDADPNVVCAAYESFIIDTLNLTKRPTKTLLEKACLQAFEGCSSQEGSSFFGRQIAAAVQHCRVKSKSMSSGAKTSTSVQRIIAALDTTPAGPRYWKGAKAPATEVSAAKVGEASSKTSPAKSTGSSPASARPSLASEASIIEAYGLKPGDLQPSGMRKHGSQEAVVVSSDSEADGSQKGFRFFDQAQCVWKTILPDGSQLTEPANRYPGVPDRVLKHHDELLSKPVMDMQPLSKRAVAEGSSGKKRKSAPSKKPATRATEPGGGAADSKSQDLDILPPEDPVLHRVRIVHAQHIPESIRAYVTACKCGDENGKGHKQSLVVEFTKRRHGETYYELALSAKQRMEREGLTWTQARALRSSAP